MRSLLALGAKRRTERTCGRKGFSSSGTIGRSPGPRDGFAPMASKRVLWFTCTAKEESLMFVTFDRAYDMVWLKDKK